MAQASRNQKKKKVIDVLNKARGLELNAIAQYMNHHYNLADMDYGDMAAKMKLIAIDEMRHAELFAERIKELGESRPPIPVASRSTRGTRPQFFQQIPASKMEPWMSITSFCWFAGIAATVPASSFSRQLSMMSRCTSIISTACVGISKSWAKPIWLRSPARRHQQASSIRGS